MAAEYALAPARGFLQETAGAPREDDEGARDGQFVEICRESSGGTAPAEAAVRAIDDPRALARSPPMSLNVPLLRSSFELVLGREPDLTHRFYEVLFAKYPQVKPLFGKSSGKQQEKMLADALVAVMDHLEDAAWLEQQLGALGAKHAGYGVTDGMYAFVGDALLTTLAQVAAADWTDELAAQWGAAYGAITSLMLKGAPAGAAAE
jgi:hemoglobin-like flavoprotein